MMTPRDIADRLKLDKVRKGWRGKCPCCDYEGTFALTARNGVSRGWCASCGDREAIEAHLRNLDGTEDAAATASYVETSPPSDPQRTERAMRVWRGAADSHPALAAYCGYRGLPGLERSEALRWRPDVRHPEAKGLYPAMIALVQDVEGEPIAIHRTYLQRDGRGKADMDPQKASKGPIAGGAIRLDDPQPEMLVGEGIETAAAAGRLMGLPAWAAVSAGNMGRTMLLPSLVHSVVIASDPDGPGQRAAEAAADRWLAEGRSVHIITPDVPGMDFADLHHIGLASGVA